MSIIQTPNIGNLGDIVAGNQTPLVYKVSNSRFPLNTADTVFNVTAAAAGVFTVLTTDAAADYNLNEPLKVVLGDVSGTYQITRKISTTEYEINLRYSSLSTFTGTAQRSYRNYRAILEVYAGLPPEHPKASIRPMRKVGDVFSTPDANNVSVFNVAQEVLADIQPIESDFSQFSASPFCTPILTVFSTNPALLSFLLADTDITAFWVSELNFSSLYHFGNISNVVGLFFDNEYDADINAEVLGTVNLQNFTDLQVFRARNQNITLFFGTWVRDAGVTIDVTNSIVNGLAAMIDRLIIANGGTLNPADTDTFTGTAGVTAAGRLLALGTLTLDISAPANALLLSKIQALETVGWSITSVVTVCSKTITFYVVSDSLESGGEIADYPIAKDYSSLSLDFLIGVSYENIAFNQAAFTLFSDGTKTSVLAVGLGAINTYLSANSAIGAVIECQATPSTPNSVGYVRMNYRDLPSANWACGEQQYAGRERVLVKESVTPISSSTTTPYTSPERNQAFTLFFKYENLPLSSASVNGNMLFFSLIGNANNYINFFNSASSSTFIEFQFHRQSNQRLNYRWSRAAMPNTGTITITYDGSQTLAGINFYIDGVLHTVNKQLSATTLGTNNMGTTNRQLSLMSTFTGNIFNNGHKLIECSMIAGVKSGADILADVAAGTMSGAEADFYFKVRPTFPTHIKSLIPTLALGGRFGDAIKPDKSLSIANKPNPMDIFTDFELL